MPGYADFEAENAADRRGVFDLAAQTRGIDGPNAEKDYWVCRVLRDLMASRRGEPERFFKGGTSLSKGFGLIQRFSEDIDVVLSRDGLVGKSTPNPLDPNAGLANAQRERRLRDLRRAAREYVFGPLSERIRAIPGVANVEHDNAVAQCPTLLIWYESVYPPAEPNAYNQRRIKIDAGPCDASTPHKDGIVTPYIGEVLGNDWDLSIAKVCMIRPARTFWEKVTAIHNMHCAFEATGQQPQGRQPPSRHYYDVAALSTTQIGQRALRELALLEKVRVFGLHAFREMCRHNETAVPGQLKLAPPEGVMATLRQDYARMQGMMYGNPPAFDWIVDQLREIEQVLNAGAAAAAAAAA
jgi:hypothetical protein